MWWSLFRTAYLAALFGTGLGLFLHEYGDLVRGARIWQAQAHERNFADELATIPDAFKGAMREDRPDLVEREQKGDMEGGVLVEPYVKTNIIIFRRNANCLAKAPCP